LVVGAAGIAVADAAETSRSIVCEGLEDDAVSLRFHAKGVAIMVLVCGIIDVCLRGLFSKVRVIIICSSKLFKAKGLAVLDTFRRKNEGQKTK
jgi:hypothetical protein